DDDPPVKEIAPQDLTRFQFLRKADGKPGFAENPILSLMRHIDGPLVAGHCPGLPVRCLDHAHSLACVIIPGIRSATSHGCHSAVANRDTCSRRDRPTTGWRRI